MSEPQCPKCHGAMEVGFVVDNTYGAVAASEWASGEPVYSIWTGMKMRGRERHPVITYRCAGCGFLESYAREESKE
jgi:hypothetical protein